jgi:hypothetical protein
MASSPSEHEIQQRIRLACGRGAVRPWRNNTGALGWVTTTEACAALGMGRETLRQLRLRGVLTPGKHYRRWGCTQGRGPLQWHLENVEATITGWSRRHLQH